MRIGLTGGIASGKSSVAQVLQERGVPVVDADEVCRDVMRPGTFLFSQIVEAFGPSLVNEHGELDRAALGNLVFADPQARERLNQMSHPVIWQEMQRQVSALEATHPVVVAMVPLLLENQRQDWVDEVWLVALPESLQRQRLMQRNQLSQEQAQARIDAQMSLAEKRLLADLVIDNSGSLESTRQQVLQALAQIGPA